MPINPEYRNDQEVTVGACKVVRQCFTVQITNGDSTVSFDSTSIGLAKERYKWIKDQLKFNGTLPGWVAELVIKGGGGRPV